MKRFLCVFLSYFCEYGNNIFQTILRNWNQLILQVATGERFFFTFIFESLELSPELAHCNDAKAETPVLWPPHAKSWLIGKDSDARRDWEQEEKGTTEDEMAGWHHWLDGRESEWTPGVGDGQGGLACCNSWGRKESDTTEWLNWTELNWT